MADALGPEVDAGDFRQTRQATVEMVLQNGLDETAQVEFAWTDTKGWGIEPLRRKAKMAPGESEIFRFDVAAPEGVSLVSLPAYEAHITAGDFFCGPLTGSLRLVSRMDCPRKGAPAAAPTRPRRLLRGTAPETAADCSAEVTAAYDDAGIEFSFSVRDDRIVVGEPAEPFTGDAVHLSLFTGKGSDPHPWTLALSARPGAEGPLLTVYPAGPEIGAVSTRTDGGYRVTVAVPFPAMGMDGPASEVDAIRCELGVVDLDVEGEEPTVLYWSSSSVPFMKVGEYGQLVLSGNPSK